MTNREVNQAFGALSVIAGRKDLGTALGKRVFKAMWALKPQQLVIESAQKDIQEVFKERLGEVTDPEAELTPEQQQAVIERNEALEDLFDRETDIQAPETFTADELIERKVEPIYVFRLGPLVKEE